MPNHYNSLSGFGNPGQQTQTQSNTVSTNVASTSSFNPRAGAISAGRPPNRAYIANPRNTLGSGPTNTFNQASIPAYIPTVFLDICQDVYVQEKHVSVIRKGPTAPPTLEMFSYTRADLNANGLIDIEKLFNGGDDGMMVDHFPGALVPVVTSVFFKNNGERKVAGDSIILPILDTDMDWESGDVIVIAHEYVNNSGVIQRVSCRVVVDGLPVILLGNTLQCTLLTNTVGFPLNTNISDIYSASLVQGDPWFELKFPKFAYRYKYEDGEYSVFSPWSQIAFIPDEFDFMPKKGYNLGMTNRLRSLKIKDWAPKNMPKDVVQVDLLFKQSNSPNVYTVESFKQDDPVLQGKATNHWNTIGTGANYGSYTVKSELIHATVASNQMLRPWDNVPRKALGQEITANRLVFANYVQNYDTLNDVGAKIKPIFHITTPFKPADPSLVRLPGKSLKSMRQYQLGVVYRDRYGRETPVLTSTTGTFKVKKDTAKNFNKINFGISSQAPDWAESFTIYIKETANEYYNLAMDRWYDAEDGGVWVSFPSSERNKINDETILYLKKQHDTDISVDTDEKYKVIDIKNSAPTFIKTDKQFWGGVDMMLPPAGWGTNGRPGSWQSGMFGSTGLPLQGRLFLDVYAEYAEQTILDGLKGMTQDDLQVRIVQGAGKLAQAYNTSPGVMQTNKSDWYDVSRVSFIGEEPAIYMESFTNPGTGITTEVQLEEPNAKHPLVRLTLSKKMGVDMAFTEPNDNLDLSRGLSLEVRNSIVRNKAQFEGRFFVKLHRSNDLVRNIIQPSNPVEAAVYVVESKGIKYLSDAIPGVQTWSHQTPSNPRLDPTTSGAYGSYIPPGIAVGRYNHPGLVGDYREPAKEVYSVSSYSAPAAGCDFRALMGAIALAPNGTCGDEREGIVYSGGIPGEYFEASQKGCWPFAPGPDDDTMNWTEWGTPLGSNGGYSTDIDGWARTGTGSPSFWGDKYSLHADSHGQTRTSSANSYDWPSFIPSQWKPSEGIGRFSLNVGTFIRASPPVTINLPVGSITVPGSPAQLVNQNPDFQPKNKDSVLDPYALTVPVNPWMKPAIWGRDPFVDNGFGKPNPVWDYNTITDLNRDWMGYWNTGTSSFDTEWPYVKVNWDRWFIDNVGAAENYAGAGIWDDANVSHMAISYWGIGDNEGPITDSHDLSYHQESELSFANSLGTVGTMFRFKFDPDQTIYTITDVQIEKVFNYEGFHGSWGKDNDKNGVSDSVGKIIPPFGPVQEHPQGLAGRAVFYSDIWQGATLKPERTGRAMQNNRLRFNLTLDKLIGEGPFAFHPLLNHVGPALETNPKVIDYNAWIDAGGLAHDAVGYNGGDNKYPEGAPICNIPEYAGGGVKARISYDKTAAEHVSLEKGGTPCPLGDSTDPLTTGKTGTRYSLYNLASYWNCKQKNLVQLLSQHANEQPEWANASFYKGTSNGNQDPNPGARIGLHERGLNETVIEIIEFYDGEDGQKPMSNNPGVFETEPREDVGMDLYYAASPTYPVNLKRYRFDVDADAGWYDYGLRGEEYISVGSTAVVGGFSAIVDGVEENRIWTNSSIAGFAVNDVVKFVKKGEGAYYGIRIDEEFVEARITALITDQIFEVEPEIHSTRRSLSYFNCYSFGNGVESNRIRDDYNAVTIDKGVKASAPLAEGYEEERKASSFIFSGIYNSTSGINRTNEFIQAEPITKDLNPINGSIQKLFARDTDLVTFCENKVFKVLAKKDALFNADGNKNVTSNQAVLGATIPFEGDYGISRNPESFASESYRVYFTDKDRGTVMKLSKNGLNAISDKGMKDWFKDNLMNASSLIGSFDTREDQYNLTVETKDQDGIDNAFTLSFTESKGGGWVSFKSFITQGGISYKNKYYTFPSNNFNMQSTAVGSASRALYGSEYSGKVGMAEMWQHHVDLDFNRYSANQYKGATTIFLQSGGSGVIVIGMNVEGNGVPVDTVVSSAFGNSVTFNQQVYVENGEELRFTTARNNFYKYQSHSMVRTLFNGDQGTVKRFKALNYEGSQGKTIGNTSDNYNLHLNGSTINVGQVYNNNHSKKGWEVFEIKTDLQDGSIKEFVNKENKWFNYVRGFKDAGFGDDVDTAEFSAQGLGITNI